MGQGRSDAIAGERDRERLSAIARTLTDSQRRSVLEILSSRDQVIGLQGSAGAGKTTSLAAIREVAERQGYSIEGLAPTSRAAEELSTAVSSPGRYSITSPRERKSTTGAPDCSSSTNRAWRAHGRSTIF